MSERLGTEFQYSRRLPPPEAWKKPDKYIDLTSGLALPFRSKLVLPIDDRGFIKTDTAVEEVKGHFFWSDYDWPYTPGDHDTAPDDHHFYFEREEYAPANNNGYTVPMRFRELPTHIGWMPRQFHNVMHDFTAKPEMPESEEMEHYLESFNLALEAFKRLFKTATNTIKAERQFELRHQSLMQGTVVPRSDNDQVGQEYMKSFFDTHFKSYSAATELFRATEHKNLVYENFEAFEVARRKRVATKMGQIIARNHVNYVPLLRGTASVALLR